MSTITARTIDGADLTRFGWYRDSRFVAGTIADWARMWEGDYYAGDHGLERTLLTWGGQGTVPELHEVETVRRRMDEDDRVYWTIIVQGLPDMAYVTIDGRA